MSSVRKLILLLVAVLVIATTWLTRQQDAGDETAVRTDRGPDAYADDVRIQVMDTNGLPAYHLRAEHIAWYPDNDQLALQRPRLDVHRPDGAHWELRAEQGLTGRAGDPVSLTGTVIIQKVAANSGSALKITTADVTVMSDARLALTEAPALVEGAGYRFEATGLTADFRENRLELRSQVRGRIDAHS